MIRQVIAIALLSFWQVRMLCRLCNFEQEGQRGRIFKGERRNGLRRKKKESRLNKYRMELCFVVVQQVLLQRNLSKRQCYL
ncbi:hypothetical protein HA466_0157540 [Hirschfeldia incana]|nr:hypothetical protein HA466_0157540 [Hirschfeldia incana]